MVQPKKLRRLFGMEKIKLKLRLLQIGGMFCAFLPIIIAVIVNRKEYFATKSTSWSLGIGGALAVLLVGMSIMGKVGKVFDSGVKVTGIIFLFALLLEPIVLNLKFLSGMLFLGEAINCLIFVPQIKKLQKHIDRKETAKVIKDAING